jgi:hypothetical protein
LRRFEGEKHLIFFSIGFPDGPSNRLLVERANHSRVVIDAIQTSGTSPSPMPSRNPAPSPSPSMREFIGGNALRDLSEGTGGQASLYQMGDKALRRIDETSRAGYLLGYVPSRPAADGRYRRVAVAVGRPGLTLAYRQGYFATPVLGPVDRRKVQADVRLAYGARYSNEIRDLVLRLAGHAYSNDPAGGTQSVTITVAAKRLKLERVGERYKGTLDVLVGAFELSRTKGAADSRFVGEQRYSTDLDMDEAQYRGCLRDGVRLTVTLSRLPRRPEGVFVIVYDYGADLLGSREFIF